MSTSRRLLKLVPALALIALALPGSASAQATRTWVSGVGDDVNPCSRTAPCKTFAGAISKTANGGEINCMDPGRLRRRDDHEVTHDQVRVRPDGEALAAPGSRPVRMRLQL